MSIFEPVRIACPNCGRAAEVERARSINADRRPDLRGEIIDGGFQRMRCAGCGRDLRLEPQLVYFSIADRLFAVARPVGDLANWWQATEDARGLFDRAFNATATEATDEMSGKLELRLVFGWYALREKLVCRDAGLDDVAVEVAKSLLFLTGSAAPIGDRLELRLLEAAETSLRFGLIEQQTGLIREFLDMPRSLLDEVAADPDMRDLAARLRTGPFVDLQKMLLPPVAVPEAAEI
jgi:hypothetical protein